MSNIPHYITKKTNYVVKSKKKQKPIPININSHPFPNKFLFSNHVNDIASSYLIGIKNKNKNIKPSKAVHINTNSATNYYTINSKDTKQTNNSSFTNSLIYNNKNTNRSNLNSFNYINNININNNNNNSQQKNQEINKNNNNDKKQYENNNISKSIFINLYENQKIFKKNKTTINHLSKIKQKNNNNNNNKHYLIDSKNKGKKIPMKSKLHQNTFQYRNSKPASASFNNNNNNKYLSIKYFKENLQRVFYNISEEKHSSNIREKIYLNNDIKNNNNKELVNKIKNNHLRHNTGSFSNKGIMNFFHKKTLSNKVFYNINSLNRNINLHKKISESKKNLNQISKNDNNNNNNINSKKNNKLIKKGKLNDIKISKEKLLNIKDIKYKHFNNNNNNSNNNNNNNNKYIYHNNHIKYYTKNSSNNISSNNNSNINTNISNNNNNTKYNNNHINILGIKKCMIKSKENTQKNIKKIKIQNIKLIPKQNQNIKHNFIPSQKNLKINFAEFLYDSKKKAKKNSNETIGGKKSLSSKKESKEKNNTFSLPQIQCKCPNQLIKTKEEKEKEKEEKILNDNKENIRKYLNNKEITQDKEQNKNINKNKDKKKDKNIFQKNNLIQYINNSNDKKIDNDNNNNKIDNDKNNNKIDNDNNKKDLDDKLDNLPKDLIYNNLLYFNLDLNLNSNNISKNISSCSISFKNDNNIENNYININNIINPQNKKNKEENKTHKIKCINSNKNIKENDINKNNINNANKNKNENKNENIDYENKNIKDDIEFNNKDNKENKDTNKDNNKENKDKDNIIKNNNNNECCKNNNNKKTIIHNNEKDYEKLIYNNIINNTLLDKENLIELPEDYDEKFDDLFSIINKINFGKIIQSSEGLFTQNGSTYRKYKDKFDKYYDNLFMKKANSFLNSNDKPKKIMQIGTLTSNTKTNSSSSKKNLINDLNIVKELDSYS